MQLTETLLSNVVRDVLGSDLVTHQCVKSTCMRYRNASPWTMPRTDMSVNNNKQPGSVVVHDNEGVQRRDGEEKENGPEICGAVVECKGHRQQ